MYRIEVASGEETVFRTIEELAVGIRNGVITPRSRIYHNASQKWLPIGLHPHYKKALELPAASTAQPAASTPKAPRTKPRHEPAPQTIPAPITSPIVAMQQEVLRDLPIVAMPEPLTPRAAPLAVTPPPPKAAAALAPAPIARIAQAVQAQPTAVVTYTPHVAGEDTAADREPIEGQREEPREARPTARRAPRAGGRPFLLLGVAAALVVGAHYALTATRSTPAGSAAEPGDAVSEPSSEQLSDGAIEPDDPIEAPEPAPRVSSAPARVPMMPGPAFAGSAPMRPGAVATRQTTAPVPSPSARSTDSASAAPVIAPPPVALELALPTLSTDSMLPKRNGDSTAMKKILRALNGAKPSEGPAAP